MSHPEPPDETLFPALSASALARAERDPASSTERADARAAAEAVGRAVEPALAPLGLRARIARSASRGGKYGKYADRLARLFDLPIDEARALLVRAEDPASFTPGPIPGTTWMMVKPGPRFAGGLATIGRLLPGTGVPDHAHGGSETTLVLEGGLVEDGSGEETWRGDELFKPEGSEHAFRVAGDGPCVAAVISTGTVTFRSGQTL